MFGLTTLDVAIGLIFLFLILSLILPSLREIIEGWLQTRAIHLERGIRELVKDEHGTGLAKMLYDHPLISSLYRGDYDPTGLVDRLFKRTNGWKRLHFRSHLPSYVPSRNIALALRDLAQRGNPDDAVVDRELSIDRIREGLVSQIADARVRRAITLAIDNAKGDLDQARINLEAWFDSGMDRVSGWYRKETQWILLSLGLTAAVALNVDSLKIAGALYQNGALRSAILADAQAVAEHARKDGASDDAAMLRALGCGHEVAASVSDAQSDASCSERRLKGLEWPAGWEEGPVGPGAFNHHWGAGIGSFSWRSIPGWLITAFAVSLGAPFWFDLLNKVMIIRSTVKPHEESPEEGSEDRQTSSRGKTVVQLQPPAAPQPASHPAPAGLSAAPATVSTLPGQLNRIEADDLDPARLDWHDKLDPMEGQ